MSKLSRGKKGESQVSDILSSLDGYHKVIDDYTYLNEKTNISHQIDHILIHPHGVFVIETKSYYGVIDTNHNDTVWFKTIKGVKTHFSNPLIQNKSHALIIKRMLDKNIDIISVVVFTRNNAPMIDDNVININDLVLFVESYPYKRLLNEKEIDTINKLLLSKGSKVSLKEHKANIEAVKKATKEKQEDKRIAIEKRICPICGNPISTTGYTYYCKKCGYKFSL